MAHPEIFRSNLVLTPQLRSIGVPSGDNRSRLEEAGAQLLLTRTPLQLAPALIASGEVPRTTPYEGTNAGLYTLRNGVFEEDLMLDDLSIYAQVRGRGVVVFYGCSHAGIVNSVRHARTVCGRDGIAAVMGGLHLIAADRATIESTVAGLREQEVDRVFAGHCTGFAAQVALYRGFGERFAPLHTGLVVSW